MGEVEKPVRPRRKTGIPRRELDRSKVYRIAYVGRRWEVIGEGDGTAAPEPPRLLGADDAGTRAQGAPAPAPGPAPTAPTAGRHAARDADLPTAPVGS